MNSSLKLIWILIGLTKAYLITYTDFNLPGADRRPKLDTHHKPESTSLDLNQIIIFNIGDFVSLENYTRSFRQKFDPDSINYCNFDPDLLSNKLSPSVPPPQHQASRLNPNFNVNIFLKGGIFNQSSQITVRIEFLNQLAESNQLWYLLEAKSACTNQVVGTWQLIKQPTTDTIYCYNRDDTVFGHKNNQQDKSFDQIWLPTNTYEDIYFVIALFTDEAYSSLNPSYFILSSPIFQYQAPDRPPISPYINERSPNYDPCRSSPSSPNKSSSPGNSNQHLNTDYRQPLSDAQTSPSTQSSQVVTSSSKVSSRTSRGTVRTTLPNRKHQQQIKSSSAASRTTTTSTTITTSTTSSASYTKIDFEKIKSNFHKLFTTNHKKILLTLGAVQTSVEAVETTTEGAATMMTESEVVIENYKPEKSILIDLIMGINQCLKQEDDLAFINDIKAKLTDIYRGLANFKRVVIKEIINYNCSTATRKKRDLEDSSQFETSERSATATNGTKENYKLSVQHYVIFRTSIKNQTRVEAIKTLKNSFSTISSITNNNLTMLDTYFVETNGTSISFNNPCSMYNYFRVCQNNGVCKMSENLTPSCSCPFIDEYSYWTGDYCDVKVKQPFDLEKFKMIIAISVLGAIALICVISLLVCLIYKRRQNKEIHKKYPSKLLISSSTSSNFSTASNKNAKNSNTETTSKIHHQYARSVIGSATQHSQLNLSAAATMIHQQQHYDQPNYILLEHSPTAVQPGAFVQSPEYMSIQDLVTNNHLIKPNFSPPPPLKCSQSPPTPVDVALVEDLRFCFSLRKGSEPNDEPNPSHRHNHKMAAKQANLIVNSQRPLAENMSPTGSSGSSETSSSQDTNVNHSSSSTTSSSELFHPNNIEERRRLIKTSNNQTASLATTSVTNGIPNKGLVCLTDGSSTSYKFYNANNVNHNPSSSSNVNSNSRTKMASSSAVKKHVSKQMIDQPTYDNGKFVENGDKRKSSKSPKQRHGNRKHPNDDFIQTLSYPREITITSTPMRASSHTPDVEEQAAQKLHTSSKKNANNKPVNCQSRKISPTTNHQHVNHAYDMTLVKNNGHEITKIAVPYNQPVTSSPLPTAATAKVASFSIQSIHNMFRNSIRGIKGNSSERPVQPVKSVAVSVCGLKRESSQLVPQSIEKQMARNFQSIKPFGASTNVVDTSMIAANSSLDTSATDNTHGHFLVSTHLNTMTFNNGTTNTTSNNNPTSKYTDSTSLPTSHGSSAEQSLKDEDAWLPILTLAEEQIKKLEAEKLKEAFLTESYVF